MNMTRTITMIRSGQFLAPLKQRVNAIIEQKLAAFFGWALSKRAVQEEIADAIQGNTPLCHLIRGVCEDVLDRQREVDVDDITGLERYVEQAIEEAGRDLEIHAENVKDLDDAIAEVINRDEDLQEELTNAVCKTMAERLAR